LLLSTPDNKGLIAGRAAVTTVLCAAAGCISSLLITGLMAYRQTGEFYFDIVAARNGWQAKELYYIENVTFSIAIYILTGLVAITGSCGFLDYWAALVIGAIGASFF
jgi:Ammonium Transporter Family